MNNSLKVYTAIFWLGLAVVIGFLVVSSQAHDQTLRVSRVVRVYDGDTVYVDIDGLPDVFGKNIGIRILDLDTPEVRGGTACTKQMAAISKGIVEKMLAGAETIVLQTPQRGKYFRLLGDLYADGKSVGQELIAQGRARAYDGNKKLKWECDPSWFN